MKIKTIKQLWDSYKFCTDDPLFSELEHKQMCFYAGALVMYGLLMNNIIVLSSEDMIKECEKLVKELDNFAVSVIEPRV